MKTNIQKRKQLLRVTLIIPKTLSKTSLWLASVKISPIHHRMAVAEMEKKNTHNSQHWKTGTALNFEVNDFGMLEHSGSSMFLSILDRIVCNKQLLKNTHISLSPISLFPVTFPLFNSHVFHYPGQLTLLLCWIHESLGMQLSARGGLPLDSPGGLFCSYGFSSVSIRGN